MASSQTAGELARQLAELTGELSTPPERLEEREHACRLLARSRPGDTAAQSTGVLWLIATEAASATANDAHRNTGEEWAAPPGASETSGPFLAAVRSGVWFDLFQEAELCRRR